MAFCLYFLQAARGAEKLAARDLRTGAGRIRVQREVVRLKAMLLDPESPVNEEPTPERREASYYFDLHDLDGRCGAPPFSRSPRPPSARP